MFAHGYNERCNNGLPGGGKSGALAPPKLVRKTLRQGVDPSPGIVHLTGGERQIFRELLPWPGGPAPRGPHKRPNPRPIPVS